LLQLQPKLASRIHAPGHLDSQQVSAHLAACDVLIQPFVDGANARRTSLTAGLAHGAAIVTTVGRMTEPFWTTSGSVVAVPTEREDVFVGETLRILGDPSELARLRGMSRKLYDDSFDLGHTLRILAAI
jgi:hypothetical protein